MRGKAIYRISYLAKTRGKGYRDPQAKDYETSIENSSMVSFFIGSFYLT